MKPHSFAGILTKWVGNRLLSDCANKLDVSDSTLSDWMKGTYLPWNRAIRRMAPVLRMKPELLIRVCEADRRLGAARPRVKARKPRVNRPAKRSKTAAA